MQTSLGNIYDIWLQKIPQLVADVTCSCLALKSYLFIYLFIGFRTWVFYVWSIVVVIKIINKTVWSSFIQVHIKIINKTENSTEDTYS